MGIRIKKSALSCILSVSVSILFLVFAISYIYFHLGVGNVIDNPVVRLMVLNDTVPVVRIHTNFSDGYLYVNVSSNVNVTCKIGELGVFGNGVNRVDLRSIKNVPIVNSVSCYYKGAPILNNCPCIKIPGSITIRAVPNKYFNKHDFSIVIHRYDGVFFYSIRGIKTKYVVVSNEYGEIPPMTMVHDTGLIRLRIINRELDINSSHFSSECRIIGSVITPSDIDDKIDTIEEASLFLSIIMFAIAISGCLDCKGSVLAIILLVYMIILFVIAFGPYDSVLRDSVYRYSSYVNITSISCR